MMEDGYASKPTNSDKRYHNFHKFFKGQWRAGKLNENQKRAMGKITRIDNDL